MPGKTIEIVGGGLAGLTLAIGLRQRGVPVRVLEMGGYPRHRVCGEFISGRGIDALRRLDLFPTVLGAGALEGQTAKFVLSRHSAFTRPLPEPALMISRFHLDQCLADKLLELSGELIQHAPRASVGRCASEGVVRATGRRLNRGDPKPTWFGLKVHASGVTFAEDLEMHAHPKGYVGLCRLPKGEVNICGLFRGSEPAPPGVNATSGRQPSWRDILTGPTGSPLHQLLETARFDLASFCSVAGLSLRPFANTTPEECSLGDALTMTPPVTGNGMSMAFESAELALEPLTEYSHGTLSWDSARQTIAGRCHQAFDKRLRWARLLQSVMTNPLLQRGIGGWILNSPRLWNLMFDRTRSAGLQA